MNITHANILDWAREYRGPKFHACLCDAPYEMEFMGKGWDNSGVAFDPDTWRLIAQHLHPGAFLFVFAGTLNDDLISVAMRQAGLRKYHRAMAWSYGSGFPKATRLDVAIDRRAGAERATVGTRRQSGAKFSLTQELIDNGGFNDPARSSFDVTAPATDAAQTWQGHRYGGQALKPAVESILVFQRPYAGRPLDSIVATGAGALWIDGGRIGSDDDLNGGAYSGNGDRNTLFGIGNSGREFARPAGRWPANFALVHHPACDAAACHADCTVLRLGAQSGELSSGERTIGTPRNGTSEHLPGLSQSVSNRDFESSTGTAARFFFNSDWMYERLEAADQVGYFAKASRAEREAGLDPRTIAMLGADDFAEATINDGRAKSIDNPYQRGETTRRNIHATVKPISLARWLATLLLPPAEYGPRRLLVPFAGVASEMIGAMLAGWEEIEGIELGADHVEIARARMAYWQQRRYELLDPAAPLTVKAAPDAPRGQLDMFFDEAA